MALYFVFSHVNNHISQLFTPKQIGKIPRRSLGWNHNSSGHFPTQTNNKNTTKLYDDQNLDNEQLFSSMQKNRNAFLNENANKFCILSLSENGHWKGDWLIDFSERYCRLINWNLISIVGKKTPRTMSLDRLPDHPVQTPQLAIIQYLGRIPQRNLPHQLIPH